MASTSTDNLDDVLAALRAEFAEISNLPDETQTELERGLEAEKEAGSIQSDIEQEQKISDEMAAALAEKTAEVERLRSELKEREAQGEAWKQQHRQAVANREELEERVNQGRTALEELMKANEIADEEVNKLNEENEQLLQLLGPGPEELNALQERADELESDLETLEDALEKTKEQQREKQAMLNFYKKVIAESGGDIDELTEAVLSKVAVKVNKEIQQLRERNAELEGRRQQREAELLQLERDERLARIDVDKDSATVIQDNAKLQAELQETERKVAQHRQEAAELAARAEQLKSQLEEQNASLKNQLEQANEALSREREDQARFVSQVEELTKSASSSNLQGGLQAENARLAEELADRQRQVREANSFEQLQQTVLDALDVLQQNLAKQNQALAKEVDTLRGKIEPPHSPASPSQPASSSSGRPRGEGGCWLL